MNDKDKDTLMLLAAKYADEAWFVAAENLTSSPEYAVNYIKTAIASCIESAELEKAQNLKIRAIKLGE